VGDASIATAEKGRATCAHQVAGFIGLLRKVRDLPPGFEPTLPG
jgi:creatinine amidohydrolase